MPRPTFLPCIILTLTSSFVALVGSGFAQDGPKERDRLALLSNEGLSAKFDLGSGGRVVMLGGTYIERLQMHNYFEAMLTATRAESGLTFRNLGWSGDNVWGHARAVFGEPDKGFERLERDLDTAIGGKKRPLVMLHYGGNEAHQGEAGLKDFLDGLNRLLDTIQRRTRRMALVLPRPYETKSPPLPNPKEYNEKLQLYREAIKKIAEERKMPTIDLARVLENATDNGVHPTEAGHKLFARSMVQQMGNKVLPWEVDVDAKSLKRRHLRAKFSEVESLPTGVKFSLKAQNLLTAIEPTNVLTVTSLTPGNYEVLVDGKREHLASAKEWADGVKLRISADAKQFDALRAKIAEKNELFFHRHRPQNETYLFLFRKHEQGNNAVEIPQFDPLIAAKEKEIAALKKPKAHVFELRLVK